MKTKPMEKIPESEILIRNYRHPDDYSAVYQIWKIAGKGIHITTSDTPDEIEKLTKISPGLFFVAEYYRKIIGTVMGGFDGRRGLIYHLAVSPEFRNQHIGSRLMQTVENQLQILGCKKVYLFIAPENQDIFDYYQKQGYEKMTAIPFTKYLKN